jgi:hypothetical protein
MWYAGACGAYFSGLVSNKEKVESTCFVLVAEQQEMRNGQEE